MAFLLPSPNPDRRFLDRFFAPFRSRRPAPQKTIGVSGAAAYAGFLQSNEKDRRLIGREKYLTYSNMLANISIVAAGTRYFLNLTAKAQWSAEPADDSPEAVELAETIEDMMQDMATPWHRVVRRAAMYKFHGFSIQEWSAKRRESDGLLGMRDVEARPQVTIERWDLDASGTVFGVVQRSPQTQEEIYLPRGKLVYMVDDALNDTPEGLGLFRNLVEPADRLCRFQELEAFGYETDLRGIPLGRAPMAALQELVGAGKLTSADRDTILKNMRDFIQNHIKSPQIGLLLDSLTYAARDDAATPSAQKQWDMELMKGDSANSSEAVAEAIVRIQFEMARIMGVEGLLLGQGKTGSLALSKDKTHSFALLVDSTLSELTESFEQDWVEPIFQLNGWDMDLMPTLKTEATRYRDIEEVTGALVDMAQAGAILAPDDPAIGQVRDLLGLSKPESLGLTMGPFAAPEPATPSPGPSDEEVPEAEDTGTDEE